VFSARQIGAPHRRERLFLLAYIEPRRRATVGNSVSSDVPKREPRPITPAFAAAFPPSPADSAGWREALAIDPTIEPAIRRVADGPPARVERLRALGDAVVPLVAGAALLTLAKRAGVSLT
jgi:site-specific DNA-cytosine methylase